MKHTTSIDPLLLLRGASILAVILYHMQYPGVLIPAVFGMDIHWITTSSGMVAVWILLIISGYLIGKGFYTHRYPMTIRGILKFYWRRILRIAPLYYGTIFVMAVVFRLWLTDTNLHYITQLLTFTAQDLFYRADVNYLWVLSVEMQWYLISPLCFGIVYLILKKLKSRFTAGILVLFLLGAGTYFRHIAYIENPPIFDWQFLRDWATTFRYNLDFFLFGLLLNFIIHPEKLGITKGRLPLYIKNPHIRRSVIFISLAMLYVLFSYVQYMLRMEFASYIYFTGVILPVIVMIVIGWVICTIEYPAYLESRKSLITTRTRIRFTLNPLYLLQWFGVYSYEAYLFHMPILTTFGINCNSGTVYFCSTDLFIRRFLLLAFLSVILGFFCYTVFYTMLPRAFLYIQKHNPFTSPPIVPHA
jgi:peptidoglycan/LPS O-acetylase OafA/YrhL